MNYDISYQLSDLGLAGSWRLTDKQQRFILAYITNGNDRRKALIDAGYKTNPKNVDIHASKLLKDPVIKKYLREMQDELRERAMLDAEYILRKHQKIVDQFIPDSDEAVLNVREVSAAQSSLDGICRVNGLYAAEKRQIETKEADPDIEKAKEVAREKINEY